MLHTSVGDSIHFNGFGYMLIISKSLSLALASFLSFRPVHSITDWMPLLGQSMHLKFNMSKQISLIAYIAYLNESTISLDMSPFHTLHI